MSETRTRGPYKTGRRLAFGSRAWDSFRLYFQLGGATADQDARFLGRHRQVSYQTIRQVFRQRLVDKAPVETGGRPMDFVYLSKRAAGEAIVMGAQRAGLRKETEARDQYKLFQLPGTVEHHWLRNELYLTLRAAALLHPDVDIPLWRMWGESWVGDREKFPLRGEGRERSGPRQNARVVFERVWPDGIFALEMPGSAQSAEFVVEVETESRKRTVVRKLDAYAGRWLWRQENLGAGGPLAFEGFWPVLFFFRRQRTAEAVFEHVRRAARENSPDLSRYLRLRTNLKGMGAKLPPGAFFLFAGLDGLLGDGEGSQALGPVWRPLTAYPPQQGGERVELTTVAEVVGRLRNDGGG